MTKQRHQVPLSCVTQRSCRRAGITLIEVVAALVIVGGSATAMLLAQARNLEKLTGSRVDLAARDIASELIGTWRLQDADLKTPSEGRVGTEFQWRWKRSAQVRPVTDAWSATEITLELTLLPLEGSMRTRRWEYTWLVNDDS